MRSAGFGSHRLKCWWSFCPHKEEVKSCKHSFKTYLAPFSWNNRSCSCGQWSKYHFIYLETVDWMYGKQLNLRRDNYLLTDRMCGLFRSERNNEMRIRDCRDQISNCGKKGLHMKHLFWLLSGSVFMEHWSEEVILLFPSFLTLFHYVITVQRGGMYPADPVDFVIQNLLAAPHFTRPELCRTSDTRSILGLPEC